MSIEQANLTSPADEGVNEKATVFPSLTVFVCFSDLNSMVAPQPIFLPPLKVIRRSFLGPVKSATPRCWDFEEKTFSTGGVVQKATYCRTAQ